MGFLVRRLAIMNAERGDLVEIRTYHAGGVKTAAVIVVTDMEGSKVNLFNFVPISREPDTPDYCVPLCSLAPDTFAIVMSVFCGDRRRMTRVLGHIDDDELFAIYRIILRNFGFEITPQSEKQTAAFDVLGVEDVLLKRKADAWRE
jgi:hypothetical protein